MWDMYTYLNFYGKIQFAYPLNQLYDVTNADMFMHAPIISTHENVVIKIIS